MSAVLALSLVPAAAFADSAAGEGAQPAVAETDASASNDAAIGGESGSAGGAEMPGAGAEGQSSDAGSAEEESPSAGTGSDDQGSAASGKGAGSASAEGVEESDAEAVSTEEDLLVANDSAVVAQDDSAAKNDVADGITLPGNYASRGVTIDGVDFLGTQRKG